MITAGPARLKGFGGAVPQNAVDKSYWPGIDSHETNETWNSEVDFGSKRGRRILGPGGPLSASLAGGLRGGLPEPGGSSGWEGSSVRPAPGPHDPAGFEGLHRGGHERLAHPQGAGGTSLCSVFLE